jgi:hypothetical protein
VTIQGQNTYSITFELAKPATFNGLTGTHVRWALIHEDRDDRRLGPRTWSAFLLRHPVDSECQGVQVETDGHLPDPLPDWLPTPPVHLATPSPFAPPQATNAAAASTVTEVQNTVALQLDAPVTIAGVTARIAVWSCVQRGHGEAQPISSAESSLRLSCTDDQGLTYLAILNVGAPAPVWVPTPPLGWDAYALAFRAHLEEESK